METYISRMQKFYTTFGSRFGLPGYVLNPSLNMAVNVCDVLLRASLVICITHASSHRDVTTFEHRIFQFL